MNATYLQGNISFDFQSLLEVIPQEQKLELIESLSCDDAVINHVTDQILDGWTESGYHGGIACVAGVDPRNGLDRAVREIARRSGEVAAKEIERLEKALEFSKKETATAWQAYHERYTRL